MKARPGAQTPRALAPGFRAPGLVVALDSSTPAIKTLTDQDQLSRKRP